MGKTMTLSTLSKTWIFDLDGTIVKHNGYKIDGYDTANDFKLDNKHKEE